MFHKIIITSGPTIEPIDPVRFISNRSSGRSGFFLATEAKQRKIKEIYFITGPSRYIPSDVNLVEVETAAEMRSKVLQHADSAQVIIMAAAVSDYKSCKYYPEKFKKDNENLTLELVKNPDILYELGQKKRPDQILVGFAAETENIFKHAEAKFKRKRLDLLILNQISLENPAFDQEYNQVYFVRKEGISKLDRLKKAEIATLIWDEIYKLAREKGISAEIK
jgi:phosphopantothenoylcysteine decarboxylase/phosphopantothenate--cysteine ligase